MANESLPVAIIGVGGCGSLTLQALQRSKIVKLVGIADKNPTVAAQAGREANVPAYTDNRSVLVETRPRAVYLAMPPMAVPDLLKTCAERGIHVWKESPLARNLAEGVALVRHMENANLKLAVGTQRRFAHGYRQARQLQHHIGRVFLGRARYMFNWGPDLNWRGDKTSAGGGALLELGYHLIDLFAWMLGLPEEVYGCSAGGNRPEPQASPSQPLPVYETDDTAAAILRFGGGAMATIVTSRFSGPVSEELSLHGLGGSLTADSETCLLRDPDGNVTERADGNAAPLDVFQRQAESFARAVLSDARTYECSGRENLLNLAAIEAIYLSGRTSHPENPSRLLETHGLTAAECLSYRPPEQLQTAPAGD